MNCIWLIAESELPAAAAAVERLGAHFGGTRVVRGAGDRPWRPGDAVVVFLTATPAEWSSSAGRDAACRLLHAPCVEQALAAEATLIPVLVDAARMPAAEQLPASLRALAYRHALPLRTDVQMPRDLGRLVEDLEAQLRHVVGESYPWEYWLLPAGVTASLLGGVFSFALFQEASDWSFAYETRTAFRHALTALAVGGPVLLGSGGLAVCGGLWLRRRRLATRQRAEVFRRGAGALPPIENERAWGCWTAGIAGLGWGLGAAAPALVLAVAALRSGPRDRRARRLVAVGLAAATLGVLWTVVTIRRAATVDAALADYETGKAALDAGDPAGAAERLAAAAALCPAYANAPLRLAQAHAQMDRPVLALAAVERALALYPAGTQGLISPSRRLVAEAYTLRAKLRSDAGEKQLAERDRLAASAVSPFFDIFGGFFRYWDLPP